MGIGWRRDVSKAERKGLTKSITTFWKIIAVEKINFGSEKKESGWDAVEGGGIREWDVFPIKSDA